MDEIDRKINVTAILFLLVQNRHQTHGWILIGSGAMGLGIQEWQEMYNSFLHKNPQIKINSLEKQKHGYLIYIWSDLCKPGITSFAWRVTWNYAYSPFKKKLSTGKEMNIKREI